MNIRFQMIDTDTGEIIITRYKDFVMSFATKNDAGFRTCVEWCMSAVRGVRDIKSGHKNIELRIGFQSERDTIPLPFGKDIDAVRNLAKNYVR